MTLTIAALTTASALFVILRLFNWRTVLRHRAFFDVLVTGGLMALFAGTLTGTVTAAVSGLFLSVILTTGHAVWKATSREARK